MITKLTIPVIDTERGEYRYDGKLSREAYSEMEYDEFSHTNNRVGKFVDNMRRGISNAYSRGVYDVDNSEHPDIIYTYSKAETLFKDMKKEEIEIDFFENHYVKQDMFILILNINPTNLDNDAESEIRYWLEDSRMVHNDKTLDDKIRLVRLPARFFKLEFDDCTYILENCKVLQNYSNKKFPYNFAILVEKIIKETR